MAGYSCLNHFPEVERLIFCSLYSFAFFSLHLYIQPYGTRSGNVSQNAQQVIICLLFVFSSMLLTVSDTQYSSQTDLGIPAYPLVHKLTNSLNDCPVISTPDQVRDAVCCSGHGISSNVPYNRASGLGGLNCSCVKGWSGSVCSHNDTHVPLTERNSCDTTEEADGVTSVQFKDAHYTLLVLLVVAIFVWACIFVWSIFGTCAGTIVRAGVRRYKQHAEARRKNNAHWASYEDPLMDDDREEAKSMEQQHVQRPRGSSSLQLTDFESKSTVVLSERSLDDDAGSAAGGAAFEEDADSVVVRHA